MKISTLCELAIFSVMLFGGMFFWYKFGMAASAMSIIFVGMVSGLIYLSAWIKEKGY